MADAKEVKEILEQLSDQVALIGVGGDRLSPVEGKLQNALAVLISVVLTQYRGAE